MYLFLGLKKMINEKRFSILIPAFNEEKNILPLYNSLKKNLSQIDYEIIFIDDGSTDDTRKSLKEIKDKKVRVIGFKKNKGKSLALFYGIKEARSEIIATIDADLQINPRDVIFLFKKLKRKNCDLICGWRYKRKDKLSKKIFSWAGNILINTVFHLKIHDNDCPLKVFKKSCFDGFVFFENFHRFIPPLLKNKGYKICEEKIDHYPRLYGKSKYGIINRVIGNLKTLIKLKYKIVSGKWS